MNIWTGSFLFTLALLQVTSSSAQTNTININMSADDFRRYSAPARAGEQKVVLSQASVSINGAPAVSAKLNTRGQSCLGASRRCYGIEFAQDAVLYTDSGETWKTNDFNLASMYEDTGYINNRLGYSLSEEIKLATVKNTYTEVFFNGHSQGLYLILQKPQKVTKKLKSPIIIRRREASYFEVKKFYPEYAKYSQAQYTQTLQSLYDWARENPTHPEIYQRVRGRINLPQYFKLLTLQTLISSGDYSDELYFYARPGIDGLAFDVLAWDFEDLFAAPHTSRENSRAGSDGWFNRSILYSFEDSLDRAIFLNGTLRSEFNRYAKQTLENELTPEVFRKVIEKVKASVLPYFDRTGVVRMSKLDDPAGRVDTRGRMLFKNGYYTKKEVEELLEIRYRQMVQRRVQLLNKIQ